MSPALWRFLRKIEAEVCVEQYGKLRGRTYCAGEYLELTGLARQEATERQGYAVDRVLCCLHPHTADVQFHAK